MFVLLTSWDAIINGITAGLLALFGIWLWTLQPRTRLTKMLALFATTHGVNWVFYNVVLLNEDVLLAKLIALTQAGLNVAAAWALLSVAREVLRPAGVQGLRVWRGAMIGVGVGTSALVAGFLIRRWADFIQLPFATRPVSIAIYAAYTAFVLSFAVLPFAFAWLFAKPPPINVDRARSQALILGSALMLWPPLTAMGDLLGPRDIWWIELPLVVSVGVFWLWNTQLDPKHSRGARNAGLLVFALLLFATVDNLILARVFHYSDSGGPFYGVARLATVIILAHAILRHDILGFDVKMRWGISRTTVAAVFVAVFFTVSGIAQQFFSDRLGGTYAGIVAAGMLVFANAPLQRMTERLAEKAVPVKAGPENASLITEAHERYRLLLRRFLHDGRTTREEDIALAHAAAGMGIPGHEALRLRHEVEDEVRASAAG